MENAKENSVGFQLVKIITEQFAIISDVYDSSNKDIAFSVNIKYGIDKKEKTIASVVKIQFEQKKSAFLIIEISNHYKIEQPAWDKMLKNNEKLMVPKDFATHLLVLTIGTLRGVLHAKTEDTEYNQFVLPTLNVSEFLQEDIELDL